MPIGVLVGLAAVRMSSAQQLGGMLRTGEETVVLTALAAVGTSFAASAVKPRK